MIPWYSVLIALAVGGLVTSIVEYKIGYNLIDKIVDLFRSTESKAAAEAAKLKGKL